MISRDGQIYFTRDELACSHCGKLQLAPGFADELLQLRLLHGRPMRVNCCCRCEEHNSTMMPKGHPRSLHMFDGGRADVTLGTCAIDIAVPPGKDRGDLVSLAWARGWSVIIYSWGVHLDRRQLAGLPSYMGWGSY